MIKIAASKLKIKIIRTRKRFRIIMREIRTKKIIRNQYINSSYFYLVFVLFCTIPLKYYFPRGNNVQHIVSERIFLWRLGKFSEHFFPWVHLHFRKIDFPCRIFIFRSEKFPPRKKIVVNLFTFSLILEHQNVLQKYSMGRDEYFTLRPFCCT